MKKLLLILAVILAASCSRHVPVAVHDSIVERVEYIRHDTAIYLTDSAGFRAALECDSLGRVRIKQITDYYSGQFVNPTVMIRDNFIRVDCKIDSAKIAVTWWNKNTSKIHVKTLTVTQEVRFIPWWVKILAWAGAAALVLLLVYFGWKFVSMKYGWVKKLVNL